MDLVVWLAIGTLLAVFILAASVLIALLWRRREQDKARRRAESDFTFTRDNDKVDNLVELVPLLDTELKNCGWAAVEGASEGPFADVVAILKLTTTVVKTLSGVSVLRATTKVYEVIAQSMCRVNAHFHELLEFTPVESADLRVIEARALTLTTTVWSLNAAFTLHGIDEVKEKEVEALVVKMYEHVDSLREHCRGIGTVKKEVENDEDEEERAESQSTEETTSGTIGPVEAVITHSDLPPSTPHVTVAEVHEEENDEKTALLKRDDEEEDKDGLPSETIQPPSSSPSKSDTTLPTSNGSPPKIDSVSTSSTTANGTNSIVEESNPLSS